MKILIFIIFLSSMIYANYFAKALEGTVKVKVDNQIKILEKNDKIDLKNSEIICFIESKNKGRVLVTLDSFEKQLSTKSSPCIKIEIKDQLQQSFTQDIKNKIISLVTNVKENSKDGATRNSGKVNDLEIEIFLINKNDNINYIQIKNNSWSPLPISLEIVSSKGKIKQIFQNIDNYLTTEFIIPIEYLEHDDYIIIKNRFDKILSQTHIQIK